MRKIGACIVATTLTFMTIGCGQMSSSKAADIDYETLYVESGVVGDLDSSYFFWDGDDIPELAVYSSDTSVDSPVQVYTISGGKVKNLGEYGQYGNIEFCEKENVLVSESDTASAMYVVAYSLNDGKAEVVTSLRKDLSDVENMRYYIDESEVSADEFRESLDRYTSEVTVIGVSAK